MTSPWTLVVGWIVIGVVVFVVAPYLPAWLGFALPLAVAAYGVAQLVIDGPEAGEVVLVLVASTLAAGVWWRGAGPRTKQK